jgi:hypothetical protein
MRDTQKNTDLTKEEVMLLVSSTMEAMPSDDALLKAFEGLVAKGLIIGVPDAERPEVTKKGKERVANHVLKEKKLPAYTNYNSLGAKFDNFIETATPNAINAFIMSILNRDKLKGIDKRTLANLVEKSQVEIKRQEAMKDLSIKVNGL